MGESNLAATASVTANTKLQGISRGNQERDGFREGVRDRGTFHAESSSLKVKDRDPCRDEPKPIGRRIKARRSPVERTSEFRSR